MSSSVDPSQHPCFNADSRHSFGRIHLPVAPNCNVQCRFCNRKFDCANESRPGVTSAVLSPGQALHYLKKALTRNPRLAVAGIAGPGDPFAEPETTMETLALVRREFPSLILCLASNGLNLPSSVEGLAKLNVSHVTITVNAVNPAVGAQVYAWVRDGRTIFRGEAAARLIWERQKAALIALKQAGITVKINTIVIPGVNDMHIPEVARIVRGLGADVLNCIPMVPVAESEFESLTAPSAARLEEIRAEIGTVIPLMRHCTRCRADASGLLGAPMAEETVKDLREAAALPVRPEESRPYVAVASREGLLVNCHLGEAEEIWVFSENKGAFSMVEKRKAPAPGAGDDRWRELAVVLKDCRMILASGVGPNPLKALTAGGLRVVLMEGLIFNGLEVAFNGGDFSKMSVPFKGCGVACRGGGGGCG